MIELVGNSAILDQLLINYSLKEESLKPIEPSESTQSESDEEENSTYYSEIEDSAEISEEATELAHEEI